MKYRKNRQKPLLSTLMTCHTAPDVPKSLKIWKLVPFYVSFQMRHLRRILVKLFQKVLNCRNFLKLDQCAAYDFGAQNGGGDNSRVNRTV